MEHSDLAAVVKIADVVWGSEYYETPEVFEQRFNFFPTGCWMYNNQGYIFSHPAQLGDIPHLNRLINYTTTNCYHIHDIALLPSIRGQGVARDILKTLLVNLPISLVAVAGTQSFWESYGFVVQSKTDYGQYMIRLS